MTSRDELVLKGPHLLSAGITVNKQSLPVLTTFSSMPKRNVFRKSEAVNSDGVSLHIFPEDEETKKLRIQFVQNTRRDSMIPSSFSCICSLHFSSGCFKGNIVANSLGFSTR